MAQAAGPPQGMLGDAEHPALLRQHSPLHEAPKPGQATNEPLRGVNLLQEVREALDDGLHVRRAALHELYHLQHTAGTVNPTRLTASLAFSGTGMV